MEIFTGVVCLLCFLLLLAKAASRKFGLPEADLFFMKLHKPLSGALFLFCLNHIFFVLRQPQTARLPGYISEGCLLSQPRLSFRAGSGKAPEGGMPNE